MNGTKSSNFRVQAEGMLTSGAMHSASRANYFPRSGEPYLSVVSLCVLVLKLFSVFGLHLLSADNFVFIIKKIEVHSYELLQVI